ncbi:MAG: hypothetical protein N2257_03915, partial [Thermodesulfovibrionales bacterium]|nr:hypothetical protein [Thermodesulfovibrionales bacterium]
MKRFQWGKTVFFSFFLICLFSINAPAQDYWLKTFGGMDTTEMPAGGTLKPTSDGNYILAGETNGDILITKISPSGGILWSKRYDNNQMNDYPDEIIETSDGGFLIAGESEDDNVRRLILFKLSSDLNIQWQKEIQGEFFAGLAEEEGGYIASGTFCTDTDCDGFIMKVSKENGALISLTLYGDPDIIDGILGIDKTSDGYIATGATDVTFDQDGELQSANIWVLKIKQDGTIDWQKKYGPGLGRIVKVTENGFVVGAMGVYNNNPDFLVIKIGSSGIVEWAKSYGGSGEEEIMDMLVHGDDILISGLSYSTSQNPRDGVLLKISGTDGSILWQKYIDSGYQGDELNAIALTENGYLVAGAYSINWQDILIAKLSYNGEIEQPCLIYGDASLQVTSHIITPEDTSATETELDPITLPDISLGQDDLAFITYQQCPAINYNYTLNVSLINPEYGIVWADGIYCGTDCTHSYAQGTQITLTANAYYAFTGWGGDCSGCGNNISCTIIMDSNKNCTAAFSVPPVLHTLTITKTGEGKVTSNDGRIDCGTDCTEVYNYGDYLWLDAQPGAGYVFDSWEGDCSSCSYNNCGIFIDSDKN